MTRLLALMLICTAPAALRQSGAPEPSTAGVPAKLTDKTYLYEVARYLYRWALDERDLDRVIGTNQFVFWVAKEQPKLDPGDRSRFGKIVLPQVDTVVSVKQADYDIPELAATVKSDTYKITNVARAKAPAAPPPGFVEIKADYGEMRAYLFRTRSQSLFPSDDLILRMRLAVRRELLKDVKKHADKMPTGRQIVHLAPLSPVANEAWVFWESGRLLIRFASDLDLDNPAVWEHVELAVKTYDIDEQVVVSLDEVAGSNAYLTRDYVGRVLFNCVVLGRRLELEPLDASATSAAGSSAPLPDRAKRTATPRTAPRLLALSRHSAVE